MIFDADSRKNIISDGSFGALIGFLLLPLISMLISLPFNFGLAFVIGSVGGFVVGSILRLLWSLIDWDRLL